LIFFNTSFHLPLFVPLLHIDPSDNDSLFNRIGFDHISRIFINETNHDELLRAITSRPISCEMCDDQCHLSSSRDVLDHVFTSSHIEKFIQQRGSISKREFS
ncbi:hypothetical protein PENTCL1PPCAC_7380, partial [Pristionchus entomophagus]